MYSIKKMIRLLCCFNIDLNNNFHRIKSNYECNVCMSSGRPPNMLGRFIKMNDTQVVCNGCNTMYNIAPVCEDPIIQVVSNLEPLCEDPIIQVVSNIEPVSEHPIIPVASCTIER